jgi:THO complex subunit 2
VWRWQIEIFLTMIRAPFFVTFWQLTLFEITPLVKPYKDQVSRITKLAEDHARTESSLSTMPSRERLAWNDKKDRLELFKEHLVKESNEHVAVYGATKKRLGQEKLHWFDGSQSLLYSPRY